MILQKRLDELLNSITMYRLVLYCLLFYILLGGVYSLFGILPFNFVHYTLSVFAMISSCAVINKIFASLLKTPINFESVYITSFILILIIHPATNITGFLSLALIGVLAIASKFIIAINKKHIFNPAALGVFLSALLFNHSATWWVGNVYMLPAVFLGGLLVVRKLKREDLGISFLAVAVALTTLSGFAEGLLTSPLLFFSTIMLTEPQTTPPTKASRIAYGALVGVLFSTVWRIGPIFATPEAALLAGNLFSYLVSPKQKLLLSLKKRIKLAPSIYEFSFAPKGNLNFLPGQYMEWTLPHKDMDTRGVRRFFTLASSPTEEDIKIAVRMSKHGSSFKKALQNIGNKKIVAAQLAGDFTLPNDSSQKLVFIAGGIGITPFRSMIKYLLDKNEKRDITLFFTAKTDNEFVYKDIFAQAKKKLGIKVIYTETEKDGRLDTEKIKAKVPDYKKRMFYLSGPHAMVEGFKDTLGKAGVTKIKTDYFPGYA